MSKSMHARCRAKCLLQISSTQQALQPAGETSAPDIEGWLFLPSRVHSIMPIADIQRLGLLLWKSS